MKSKRIISYFGILGVVFGLTVACKDKPEEVNPFNKSGLLTNLADELIIPGMQNLAAEVLDLENSWNQYVLSGNATDFEMVKNDWKTAYLQFQRIKMFDFGPMRTFGVKTALGIYPVDTTKINDNVALGTYVLGTAANADAVGFNTLDYLFFRNNALNLIENNSNVRTYITDVLAKIKSEVNLVINGWGSYRSTFVNSTGTESTSAFSELINEFNRDYELAKNAKVGIPLGKQSLGVQRPEYIEARYSGASMEMIIASVTALKNVYKGGSGIGMDDYLLHLERSALDQNIQSKFDAIIGQANSINGTFEEALTNQTASLDQLYLLMQQQVVYLKTDMTSAFGVLITYQDNDGD